MLTDPAEGKGEKTQPQTSWETSLAVYPRLSLLIAITLALSRHHKMAMGKEEEREFEEISSRGELEDG